MDAGISVGKSCSSINAPLSSNVNVRVALAAVAAWVLSSVPVFGLALSNAHIAVLVTLLALLVFAKHHANLRRLFAGTEPKIGQRK